MSHGLLWLYVGLHIICRRSLCKELQRLQRVRCVLLYYIYFPAKPPHQRPPSVCVWQTRFGRNVHEV